jgi:hypothetical protein
VGKDDERLYLLHFWAIKVNYLSGWSNVTVNKSAKNRPSMRARLGNVVHVEAWVDFECRVNDVFKKATACGRIVGFFMWR